eukprot:1773680-Pleurochrysis_carterae.AAC.1
MSDAMLCAVWGMQKGSGSSGHDGDFAVWLSLLPGGTACESGGKLTLRERMQNALRLLRLLLLRLTAAAADSSSG